MAVTIKDVAREAGVSISTVSRVLNRSKPVSEPIRERVERVIAELNYKPNPVARSLVMKKSQVIGVIVPNISNYKVSEVLSGIEEVGRMADFDIILCNSYGELNEELKYIELLLSKQVAGIILFSWDLNEQVVKIVKESQIPAVCIAKNAKKFDVTSVGIDHEQASSDMVQYLVDNGNQRIAFLSDTVDQNFNHNQIFDGFMNALHQNGLDFKAEDFYGSTDDKDSSYQIGKRIALSEHWPDAIFTSSDQDAIQLINGLVDYGVSVPEDISISGYDNLPLASLYRPSLTTVNQPLYDIGAIAIRLVIKTINGELDDNETSNHTIKMKHEIIKRQSVAEGDR